MDPEAETKMHPRINFAQDVDPEANSAMPIFAFGCYILSISFYHNCFQINLTSIFTLRAKLSLAVQCIVISPVCGGRAVGVCGWVCYHDNSKLCALIFTKLGL